MIKTLLLGVSTMIVSMAHAQEPTQPLDEQFLLFLASMEELDGEWVHPVDMQLEDLQQSPLNKVNQEPKTGSPIPTNWEETQ